jgi:hypothetical protein
MQIVFHILQHYENQSEACNDVDSAAHILAEGCGALWSFCVLSDDNKVTVAKNVIMETLIHVLNVVFPGNDVVTLWSVGCQSA